MSHAQIDAGRVKQACEAFIAKRDARIEKTREEEIEKAMKPKFFGLFKRTREEAIEVLRAWEWSTYNTCAIRGWSDAYQIERLLVLATHAKDTVSVSSDDADILENFL
jgi:hypothetical protein